jgi:hypothetical protein
MGIARIIKIPQHKHEGIHRSHVGEDALIFPTVKFGAYSNARDVNDVYRRGDFPRHGENSLQVVESFIREWQDLIGKGNRQEFRGNDFVNWYRDDEGTSNFPWGVEPNYVNLSMLSQLEHRDVLEIEAAAKVLLETIGSDRVPVETRRSLATLVAFTDCSKAGPSIFEAYQRASDKDIKLFLQIALGRCHDPRATDALIRGLKDSNRWLSRASFLGAERSKDTGIISPLIDRLKDSDHETAWNASFTLRRLTGGKVYVNVFVPGAEFEQACAQAQQWWETNKASYRIK